MGERKKTDAKTSLMASLSCFSRTRIWEWLLGSMKVAYNPAKGRVCESSSRLEERTASG